MTTQTQTTQTQTPTPREREHAPAVEQGVLARCYGCHTPIFIAAWRVQCRGVQGEPQTLCGRCSRRDGTRPRERRDPRALEPGPYRPYEPMLAITDVDMGDLVEALHQERDERRHRGRGTAEQAECVEKGEGDEGDKERHGYG